MNTPPPESRLQELERRLKDHDSKDGWARMNASVWRSLSVVISLFLCILFAGLYLHSAGILHLASTAPMSASAGGNAGRVTEKAEFRDLLTILVPMFAAGVAFVVSAAGMKRLQSYDDELAKARNERREDEKLLRKEASEAAEKLRQQLKDEQGELRERIAADAANTLAKQLEDARKQLDLLEQRAAKSIESAAHNTRDAVETIGAQLRRDFGFLVGRSSLAELGENTPVSVGSLQEDLSRLFQAGDRESRTAALDMLRTALARPERMFGSPDDWFNLSAELGRNNLEAQAMQVCEAALSRFNDPRNPDLPPNSDLLAHTIEFATKLGQWEKCERWLAVAEKIGREKWNWRLFVFVGDYLSARNDEQAFLHLNEDFSQFLPYDENPYSQLAQYWRNRGRLDKALEAIERGLAQRTFRAPRLLLHQAEVLLDMGRYREVIETTDKALGATANDQAAVAQWALLLQRANAFDAMFFEMSASFREPSSDGEDTSGELAEFAKAAIAHYSAAGADPAISAVSSAQAKARIRLISDACQLAGIESGLAQAPSRKDLSPEKAKLLATALVEQVDDVPAEKWPDVLPELLEQLTGQLSAQGLTQLVAFLRDLPPGMATHGRILELIKALATDDSPRP
jgi:tetratricopeptide (TPR) repeat protein